MLAVKRIRTTPVVITPPPCEQRYLMALGARRQQFAHAAAFHGHDRRDDSYFRGHLADRQQAKEARQP